MSRHHYTRLLSRGMPFLYFLLSNLNNSRYLTLTVIGQCILQILIAITMVRSFNRHSRCGATYVGHIVSRKVRLAYFRVCVTLNIVCLYVHLDKYRSSIAIILPLTSINDLAYDRTSIQGRHCMDS